MSCRRRVCATVVTVAAFFFCCVWVVTGRAWAGDNEDARVMLFSGRDIWRNGIFVYGGLVFAPGGLEQDGLLLKVLLSGGAYRYRAENLGGERITGLEALTQVLPGWRIKRGDVELKFFLGPEFQKHSRRTIPPIGCGETHSACGWRSTSGTNLRPTP
jgi:cellulose biosynthesis protein BcsS